MLGQISFSFTHKDKTKNRTIKSSNKYEIVEENLEGVVVIDLNANYGVKINNITFNIAPECFSIKKKKNVYHKLYNGRLLYIRLDTNKKLNEVYWCPFAPGCIVNGNIVKDKIGKLYFKIKDVHIDILDEVSNEAFRFYIDNINEINKNMSIKIMNEIDGTK